MPEAALVMPSTARAPILADLLRTFDILFQKQRLKSCIAPMTRSKVSLAPRPSCACRTHQKALKGL